MWTLLKAFVICISFYRTCQESAAYLRNIIRFGVFFKKQFPASEAERFGSDLTKYSAKLPKMPEFLIVYHKLSFSGNALMKTSYRLRRLMSTNRDFISNKISFVHIWLPKVRPLNDMDTSRTCELQWYESRLIISRRYLLFIR